MCDKGMIVTLTRSAIGTGRHPALWKRARSVVMFKPGKDDYTTITAYNFILPLNCMGNVVEIVGTGLL